jgi:mannose/cellobiose epimerase-like protein (N-acyl-D-glucosamine 2-epimerase family)
MADGWSRAGGLVYTTGLDGRPVTTDRLHWVITEAIGAAATLYAATRDPTYERWYRTCWDFAELHLIDRRRGSWHAELDEELQPSERTWSGKPDVYHALQATLIPRLPISASLAGAIRDQRLS